MGGTPDSETHTQPLRVSLLLGLSADCVTPPGMSGADPSTVIMQSYVNSPCEYEQIKGLFMESSFGLIWEYPNAATAALLGE